MSWLLTLPPLRIDKGDMRPLLEYSSISVINNGISMYCTSNDRDYSALSTGTFISENKHESKNMYRKMYFFDLKFSFVHILTNNVIGSLKMCIHLGNIHVWSGLYSWE